MNYVNTPLPIELISFDGKANGSQNILNGQQDQNLITIILQF